MFAMSRRTGFLLLLCAMHSTTFVGGERQRLILKDRGAGAVDIGSKTCKALKTCCHLSKPCCKFDGLTGGRSKALKKCCQASEACCKARKVVCKAADVLDGRRRRRIR